MSKFDTPKNEFLKKKQESFNLFLRMPVRFKKEWILFRKYCHEKGFEFEDVLGSLIIQVNNGTIHLSKDSYYESKKK